MEGLAKLSDRDLHEIANALRSGRLQSPFSEVAVQRLVSSGHAAAVTGDLNLLATSGFSPAQIATAIAIVQADRRERPPVDELLQLVATGPDVESSASRDTSVVVRELFASATRSVLVAGYAVFQGQRVFQSLADRMQEVPSLQVRLFLDVQRGYGDTSAPSELIARFSQRFRQTQWPKNRPLPKIFFDPRSLELDQKQRTALHAKCVVADERDVFLSSANFTEAAQRRNIELGLLVKSVIIAKAVTHYFDGLFREGLLLPLCI